MKKNFSFDVVALFCCLSFFLSVILLQIYLELKIEVCWFIGLGIMALSTLPVFFLQIKLLSGLNIEAKSTSIIFYTLLFPAAAFFASFAINEFFGMTYVLVDKLSVFSSWKECLVGLFIIYSTLTIIGLMLKAIIIKKRKNELKNSESLN